MTTLVDVTLCGPTGYRDHPEIPRRLATRFRMLTFDPGEAGGELRHGHVAEEGADDVVSETIRSHGVWEPPETILVLDFVDSAPPRGGGLMVDVGAQVGWFSMLAGSRGVDVLAIDGNRNALDLLAQSWSINGFTGALATDCAVVDADFEADATVAERISLLKIDVEGAEEHAVDAFGPWVDEGRVGRILMEVSPVFNGSYPDILWRIINAGYQVWVIPDKQYPALDANDTMAWLGTGKPLHDMTRNDLTAWVDDQHQFNIWAMR